MLLSTLLSAAPALASAPAPQSGEIDWPLLARESLELYGFEPDEVAVDLEGFVDSKAFLRTELGGLEVRIPVVLKEDKQAVKDIATAGSDLVALQGVWIRWTAGPESDLEQVEDDVEALRDWAESWSYRRFRHVDPEQGVDLRQQIRTSDKVHEAAERLTRIFESGELLGMRRVEDTESRIVLAATRESFVRLAAIGGLLSVEHRHTLWHDSIVNGMAYWFGPSQVVCMQYASHPIDLNTPFLSSPMGVTTRTRQRQHVVDRGAATLLRGYLYRHEFHFLESALATNLVIATIGENDLALLGHFRDYKRAGGRSKPYQRFVPGGNSSGGVLPPRPVGHRGGRLDVKNIPTWFRDLGRDYYVEALRGAQKEGGERASRADSGVPAEKRQWDQAHFEVSSRKSGDKTVVTAPFFGEVADRKDLPDHAFLDDYEDFFSAYKSCFFEWMRTEGAGPDGDSEALFAQLLHRLVAKKGSEDLRGMVFDLYGMPISEAGPEEDSLEWRFLEWLAGHR